MIEIKKVSKRFDKIEAVSDVSLSIEEGQVWSSWNEWCRKEYTSSNDGRGVKGR